MWYEDIKYASPNVEVNSNGLEHKGSTVPPGAQIKFKYRRGTFLFGTVATNLKTGSVWIDCREYTGRKAGKWRSFPIDQFKEQVVPKKVRKKRVK